MSLFRCLQTFGVVFSLCLAKANAQKLCTVCEGGTALRFPDEKVCQDFEPRTNGLFQTDFDCQDIQLEAYQKGCCITPPLDHCDYCADGSPYNPDLKVPSGQFVGGESCFDYKYANSAHLAMFDDGTCDDTFMRRAGHYCGCPQQKQECWLCPDKNPPKNPGKVDAWLSNSNCRGIEFLFSLLTEEECSYESGLPYNLGGDLAIYCGCGGLDEEAIAKKKEEFQCELCRNGSFMINPDMIYTDGNSKFNKSCQQAEDFARDIIMTPAGCNDNFDDARAVCCTGGGSEAETVQFRSLGIFLAAAVLALV